MMQSLPMSDCALVTIALCDAIEANKEFLSEVDGAIADGDHGINMAKGFGLAKAEIQETGGSLPVDLAILSKVLMMKIGGSMGPLYGMFFRSMAKACETAESMDMALFGELLAAARKGISVVSKAVPGDKTLMDCLVPAAEAYATAMAEGEDFQKCLLSMQEAALQGRDSTRDMVAKLGRSSRLGERSRGVLDAGSCSCYIILKTLSDEIIKKL